MTEPSSFLPPWKDVDFGGWMRAAVVWRGSIRGELQADKWQQSRNRYCHPLSTTALLKATVAPVTRKKNPFHQEISLWSLSNSDFYKSYIVIYENIIPAVYVAVIDLFMKTAIVLISVTGSQTTEQLQVEVIVLWMQWNQKPADQKKSTAPTKQNHCSKLAKLTQLPPYTC